MVLEAKANNDGHDINDANWQVSTQSLIMTVDLKITPDQPPDRVYVYW